MNKYAGAVLAALSCVLFSTTNVHAGSTGWFNSASGRSKINRLGKQSKIPVAISCKDSGKKGFSYRDILVKIEHRNNAPKKRWHVAVGTPAVKRVSRRFSKRGYKQVSQSAYTRKSGLTILCGIWHKG